MKRPRAYHVTVCIVATGGPWTFSPVAWFTSGQGRTDLRQDRSNPPLGPARRSASPAALAAASPARRRGRRAAPAVRAVTRRRGWPAANPPRRRRRSPRGVPTRRNPAWSIPPRCRSAARSLATALLPLALALRFLALGLGLGWPAPFGSGTCPGAGMNPGDLTYDTAATKTSRRSATGAVRRAV